VQNNYCTKADEYDEAVLSLLECKVSKFTNVLAVSVLSDSYPSFSMYISLSSCTGEDRNSAISAGGLVKVVASLNVTAIFFRGGGLVKVIVGVPEGIGAVGVGGSEELEDRSRADSGSLSHYFFP
jgi:hypothetical protein